MQYDILPLLPKQQAVELYRTLWIQWGVDFDVSSRVRTARLMDAIRTAQGASMSDWKDIHSDMPGFLEVVDQMTRAFQLR